MKSKKMKWLLAGVVVLCVLSLVVTYISYSIFGIIGNTDETIRKRYGEYDMVLLDEALPVADEYAYNLPFGFGLALGYNGDNVVRFVYLTRYSNHNWVTFDEYEDIYDYYHKHE